MSKDYKVGYGKPPKRTRFQKGQSGNPKGRSKGRKNMATIMKEVLARPVVIKQNGQKRRVDFSEAFGHRLAGRALEGNARDMIALMKAMHDYLPEALEPERLPHLIKIEFVTPDGKVNASDAVPQIDERSGVTEHERVLEAGGPGKPKDDAVEAAWRASGIDDEPAVRPED